MFQSTLSGGIVASKMLNFSLVGSADVRDWQTAGALRRPRPQVADRGTPSRVDKRVALDREGATDKQYQAEGKL